MPRAYCFTRFGGPETQAMLDLPVGSPGKGQLLISVRAAGVNPADWKVRSGLSPADGTVFPVVFGREVSGTVVQVGESVEGFDVGDDVFGSVAAGYGGYADYTVADSAAVAHKPQTVSFAAASCLPVSAGTAFDALAQLRVRRGETLVIIGAGGGVGVCAIQLAQDAGVDVLAVASETKSALVGSLGATWIQSGSTAAEVVASTGFDAVFDLAGGEALISIRKYVRPETRIISVADPGLAAEMGGSGVVRHRTTDVYGQVAALVERGMLDPLVTQVFALEAAGDALALVEAGHAVGKTVIKMQPGVLTP